MLLLRLLPCCCVIVMDVIGYLSLLLCTAALQDGSVLLSVVEQDSFLALEVLVHAHVFLPEESEWGIMAVCEGTPATFEGKDRHSVSTGYCLS